MKRRDVLRLAAVGAAAAITPGGCALARPAKPRIFVLPALAVRSDARGDWVEFVSHWVGCNVDRGNLGVGLTVCEALEHARRVSHETPFEWARSAYADRFSSPGPDTVAVPESVTRLLSWDADIRTSRKALRWLPAD